MEKCLMKEVDLEQIMIDVFNKPYKIKSITRILGGAQKGVYKVVCREGFTCVLYIWDESLSYFESIHTEEEFTSNSAYLFKENYELLNRYNVRVPEIYHIELDKNKLGFSYALVQYIDGEALEAIMNKEQIDATAMLIDLKDNIQKMHGIKSSYVGDLKYRREDTFSCHSYIKKSLDEALIYLFEQDERMSKLKKELLVLSETLYKAIEPRQAYTLIHYELGPNHVMVDSKGQTYLIDFEGMKYFDFEYEYSFLQLRFGKYYNKLEGQEVDQNRMKFYLFYHHIAALEGANHLLQHGYYDKKVLSSMLTYNYEAITNQFL